MSGEESGVTVYGEQRGAAVADFDHDGHSDLVVTQNAAATRPFPKFECPPRTSRPHQRSGRKPHRPRLRPSFEEGGDDWSAAREIHSGSGYWSQDAAVTVLPLPAKLSPGAQVQAQWPGGRQQTVTVQNLDRELTLSFSR